MNRRSSMALGLILVALGTLFLVNNLGIFKVRLYMLDIGYIVSRFWPLLFLILPGLAMHSIFFSGKNRDAGILVPAGILLTVGIVFQLSITFRIMHLLWPGFILAVAIGLFELYLFGTRDKALLIPVTALTAISLVFFTSISFRPFFRINFGQILLPAILIICGISIMFKK